MSMRPWSKSVRVGLSLLLLLAAVVIAVLLFRACPPVPALSLTRHVPLGVA